MPQHLIESNIQSDWHIRLCVRSPDLVARSLLRAPTPPNLSLNLFAFLATEQTWPHTLVACCALFFLSTAKKSEDQIIFRKPFLSTRQMELPFPTFSKILKFCQNWNFQSIWTALIAGIGFNKAGMGWAWVVLSWYLMYLNTLYLILHTPNPIKIFHVSHLLLTEKIR